MGTESHFRCTDSTLKSVGVLLARPFLIALICPYSHSRNAASWRRRTNQYPAPVLDLQRIRADTPIFPPGARAVSCAHAHFPAAAAEPALRVSARRCIQVHGMSCRYPRELNQMLRSLRDFGRHRRDAGGHRRRPHLLEARMALVVPPRVARVPDSPGTPRLPSGRLKLEERMLRYKPPVALVMLPCRS
jgi:hypothetical protein